MSPHASIRSVLGALVTLVLIALAAPARADEPGAPPPPEPEAKVDGQLRNYVMSTRNRGDAKDWTQWAIGGQLGYQSAPVYGVSLGVRFYSAAGPAGNSDRPDAATGIPSRYESGLFDFTDRQNREVVVLGEAFVDFRHAGHHLWAGRHRLKTPMLNPQDGRMIPSLLQGGWYQNTSIEGLTLDLGYISHAYARSSAGWGRLDDVIGIYPQGRNLDGAPADYYRHLSSAGIFVGGLGYTQPLFSAQAWDYAFQNIFNVVYSDAFLTPKFGGYSLKLGGQYVGGQRLRNGGAADPTQRYFDQDRYDVFGGKAEVKTPSDLVLGANYDRVTSRGRFVFPRELGVEPLFVFLKRERTEGSGDVHAFSVTAGQTWSPGALLKRISTVVGYGHYYRTDPRQAVLNKNAFPSLYQINWDTHLHFDGALDGLVGELLVVYKGPLSDTHDNPRFVVNKVDMLHLDFILNYNF